MSEAGEEPFVTIRPQKPSYLGVGYNLRQALLTFRSGP
jgi:hypothetical protein